MQYVAATVLRPGRGPATRGVCGLLRRLVAALRARWPHARLRVRLDAGFADPKLLRFLERYGLEYVVALLGFSPISCGGC